MSQDLFSELCSYPNLKFAFLKARKRKTLREDVIEFESNLRDNLLKLQVELIFHVYNPKPLKSFVIHDPKTRKISKSDFRDRVVHHALCNIIQPLFEKSFIFDSYANRLGKGALKAVKRFEFFSRKVTMNNSQAAFVLKADIKHYFEDVNHDVLLSIIQKRVSDKRIIWLIKKILSNYHSKKISKGMPLGNLTSQFFANVYLNELDQFVKHKLKAKYYIRYVDDFVIFHKSHNVLKGYKEQIEKFLKKYLLIQLHPQKSKIICLNKGVEFLGFRIFPYHRLLKSKNLRKFRRKLHDLNTQYDNRLIDYDTIYNFLEGWIAYSKNADCYNLRKKVLKKWDEKFQNEFSSKEINRLIKQNK